MYHKEPLDDMKPFQVKHNDEILIPNFDSLSLQKKRVDLSVTAPLQASVDKWKECNKWGLDASRFLF